MSHVFVLDAEKRPLNPVHPARARILLRQGQAAVLRAYPFTIILKAAVLDADCPPVRLKLDPGSKTTGIAVVNDTTGLVVFAAELHHRGTAVKQALDTRRSVRRHHRTRKTRYRPVRFLNRRRKAEWLPPSLHSRIANVMTWVARLRRLAPLGAISLELVKFNTQQMQDAEIRGVEYQQGELAGYEVRQYLLEKWGRRCAYCGATDRLLEVEHIVPRSRGGSDRVSNLTLACRACNERKGNQTAAEFGYPNIQSQASAPLRDAAVVNSTRWALNQQLELLGFPIETSSGGVTKYNRAQRGLPKRHWLDAACVGPSTPAVLRIAGVTPLKITAMGWGTRQMAGLNKYGFPIRHRTQQKQSFGFQTGDLVRAGVPRGKYAGVYMGRGAVRANGSFRIGRVDINHRYCRRLMQNDGYRYQILNGDIHSSMMEAAPSMRVQSETEMMRG
jgi:5-methylcytosine-specific restriction endonuclease McrA